MKKLNLTIEDMPYAAEEALNRLRVNIKFCGKNTKKILITSSVPNEGKSTVSVHLWKLLAEAGFPTVLVDVDLRKSEHNTILKMQGVEEGINHYLSGMAEYEDVVYETNIRVVIIEFQLVVIPVPEEEFTRRQNGHKRYSQKY